MAPEALGKVFVAEILQSYAPASKQLLPGQSSNVAPAASFQKAHVSTDVKLGRRKATAYEEHFPFCNLSIGVQKKKILALTKANTVAIDTLTKAGS